jgi:hypothetical protein
MLYQPVNPEREDGLLDDTLIDHVVEDGGDAQDGDGGEAHAKDTVEFGGQEGKTGFMGGLGEGLIHNANSGHLETIRAILHIKVVGNKDFLFIPFSECKTRQKHIAIIG